MPPDARRPGPGTVGRNAGSTTPDVLLYTEITPVPNATSGASVRAAGDAGASPLVNRSMPFVFSTIDDQHGDAGDHQDDAPRHRLDGLLLVDGARQREERGDGQRRHADMCMPKPATPTISTAMPASVSQWLRSIGRSAARRAPRPSARGRLKRRSRRAARNPPKPTSACASAL